MAGSERDPTAFNAPFAGLGKQLGKRLAKGRGAKLMAPEPAVAAKPAAIVEAPPKPAESIDAFPQAVGAVKPIDHRHDRIRPTHTPDFDSIVSARAADLADLAENRGFDVTYSEHFVRGASRGLGRQTLADLEDGRFAVKAHIDLHGMPAADALRTVDEFLLARQRRGDRCVLVVTGKGRNSPQQQGVLREKVPEWLARGPSSRRVLAFVTARRCDGGAGALYVLLRRTSSRKNHIDVEFGGVGHADD